MNLDLAFESAACDKLALVVLEFDMQAVFDAHLSG